MLDSLISFVLENIRLIGAGFFVFMGIFLLWSVFKPRTQSKLKARSKPFRSENLPKKAYITAKSRPKRSLAVDESVYIQGKSSTEIAKAPLLVAKVNEEDVRAKIGYFLSKIEADGASYKRIKAYVWACQEGGQRQEAIAPAFEKAFEKIFEDFKLKRLVSYDKANKIWSLNHKIYKKYLSQLIELKDLTEKEQNYFKFKNLGTGWFRLPSKTDGLEAIFWLHQNLTPDEFEQFCCALLAHHQVKDVRVSPKRESGADGGLDGLGVYHLDGVTVNVAIQAKRYRPDIMVQDQVLRDFIGSLVAYDTNYGFFITTSIFSPQAKLTAESVNENANNKIQLQLLDGHDLVKCLIYRANSSHGYGLHRTDDLGFYYLNPTMLRREIKKYA